MCLAFLYLSKKCRVARTFWKSILPDLSPSYLPFLLKKKYISGERHLEAPSLLPEIESQIYN